VPVEDVDGHLNAPGDDLGGEAARGVLADAAAEDELDLVGAAEVEVVGHQCLEEAAARRGTSKTRVRLTSIWRIDSSHQDPAAWSARPSGVGMRASQRSKKRWLSASPSRSQIACKAAGSSQLANPLASSVKASPWAAAWRLAHWWPLTHTLAGYGK
jgi:hypothetical protein